MNQTVTMELTKREIELIKAFRKQEDTSKRVKSTTRRRGMPRKSLTMDELLAVLQHAKNHSQRDFAMILIAYSHALRASEVAGVESSGENTAGLKVKHVANGRITVARLKGSDACNESLFTNDNPLLDEKKAVREYIAGLSPEAPLFPITRFQVLRVFKRYAQMAGLEGAKQRFHSLKHAGVKLPLEAGVEIYKVQKHAGHKSLASTGAYLKVTEDEAAAAVQLALNKPKIGWSLA